METIKNVTDIGIYDEELRIICKNNSGTGVKGINAIKTFPRAKYTLIAEDIERVADRTIGVEKRVNVSFKKPITCYIRGDNIYCGSSPEGRPPLRLL